MKSNLKLALKKANMRILLNFDSEAFFFIYNYINYSFESSLAS